MLGEVLSCTEFLNLPEEDKASLIATHLMSQTKRDFSQVFNPFTNMDDQKLVRDKYPNHARATFLELVIFALKEKGVII